MGFPADVIIWDFQERRELHRLSLHKSAVAALSFSRDETYLATLGGQDDNSLIVWEVARGEAICGKPAATDTAHCVSFFYNTEFQLVTAGNYHIIIWTFDRENKKLRPSPVHVGNTKRVVTSLLIDASDHLCYCGTTTGDVLVVTLGNAIMRATFPSKNLFPQGVTCMGFLANGDLLLGTGAGALIRVSTPNLKITARCQVAGGVTSLAFTEQRLHFFCGTTLSNIYWAADGGSNLTAELRNTCHHSRINQVSFPKDFSDVFATCSVGDIRVWSAARRQELLRIEVPTLECCCMDFMPDGRAILSGWSDGRLRAFLPQSGRLLWTMCDAHRGGVSALVPTNDCARIVSGGVDGDLRVWRLGENSQSMEATMKDHRGRIWCIKLLSCEARAVSASADGTCIVWDIIQKRRLLCFLDSTQFRSISILPDDSQMLTLGSRRIEKGCTYPSTQIVPPPPR